MTYWKDDGSWSGARGRLRPRRLDGTRRSRSAPIDRSASISDETGIVPGADRLPDGDRRAGACGARAEAVAHAEPASRSRCRNCRNG